MIERTNAIPLLTSEVWIAESFFLSYPPPFSPNRPVLQAFQIGRSGTDPIAPTSPKKPAS